MSVLYVTPLRALNRDLEHRLVALVREVGLHAAVRHGDTPTAQRLRQSRSPPDLLLTTPETLQLLLVGRRLREGLRNVRVVVVDELHELVASDRGAQLAMTLERLDEFVGRPVRRVGLSATIGNPQEVARFLSPSPRKVEVRTAREAREIELTVRAPRSDRPPLATEIQGALKADSVLLEGLRGVAEALQAHQKTLVFVNTRPTAEGLAARIRLLVPELPIAVHHGSLSREVREEAEKAFRDGKIRALIATSSLELGIDVGGVDLVVQFGSPHQAGRLLQRVGRSGHRLHETIRGEVIALDDEDLEEAAVLGRRVVAREIEPTLWRPRNRLALAQQIVAELRASERVTSAALFEKLRRSAPGHDVTEREWGQLLEYLEHLGSVRRDNEDLRSGRATLNRFYRTLSLIPEEKTYRLRDIGTRRWIGTLDERFVLTQVVGSPDGLFLLHGRTWKIVEFRDDELLVETVAELGQEPRWVGEDIPVPFEVAQEIGRRRRTGELDDLPLDSRGKKRLEERFGQGKGLEARPDDRTLTVTPQGRIAVFGGCFGTRTNATLALAVAGLLTARLGARVEVLNVEPTWFILGLPLALDGAGLAQAMRIPPENLAGLLDRLVPAALDYRWTFVTVARKFGVLSVESNPRDLRTLEPLIAEAAATPLGEEVLEKTLFDRFDLPNSIEVLTRIESGEIQVRPTASNAWTELPLARLRWRELPDIPPPTLLRAVQSRLEAETLTLVCLRCGFRRDTTPARYRSEGGSSCRLCGGALSAVLSPRREDEIQRVVKYAKRKWKGQRSARTPPAEITPLIRGAYTSAELLTSHGERALLALAARGIGPDTARRLLARPYRNDDQLLTEILKAERQYARTRSFWDA